MLIITLKFRVCKFHKFNLISIEIGFRIDFRQNFRTNISPNSLVNANVITVFFGSNLSLSGVTRVLAADAHVFRESEGMGGATPDLGLKTVGTPVPLHLWTCYTMADVSVKSGPVYILEISRHDFNALFPDNSNFVRILMSLQCDSGISGNGAFSGS